MKENIEVQENEVKNLLSTQVNIHSVDTSAFICNAEKRIERRLYSFRNFKKELSQLVTPLEQFRNHLNQTIKLNELMKFEEEAIKRDNKDSEIYNKYAEKLEETKKKLAKTEEIVMAFYKEYGTVMGEYFLTCDLETRYNIVDEESTLYKYKDYVYGEVKDMKKELKTKATDRKEKRILRQDALKNKNGDVKNVISIFDSMLTRTLGIKKDSTTTDIISVHVYSYEVFKNLVENGFRYFNGKEFDDYQYFTSSAGMIRDKKSLFMKTSVYKQHKNTLMCGLSVEGINEKNGMNINKFNAYLALCMTASVEWKNFDIDKCIVVDDFETVLKKSKVHYIDDETYEIKPDEMDVEINHVDGAGMYLPSGDGDKSFQFRLPWFKGLLIPFPYTKFINEVNGASSIVNDIWKEPHDIIKEDIQIIFTKSQFKMWKMWDSWDAFKKDFKDNQCKAAKCKEEEEVFNDKALNYQVLQSLNEMPKEDLITIASETVQDIEKMGTDKDVLLKVLGVTKETGKNNMQTALSIYPSLLDDPYVKEIAKETKKSFIKKARAGKLYMKGNKRTYIAPDLYAFCERLFLKRKNPRGLLGNGKVSCALYKNTEVLDVLRAPHNFREHCVRKNIVNKKTREWFITNDIYTSVHDLISKQLMFDVDGDDSLIVSNPTFVKNAINHMNENIRPLQYKLGVAKEKKITNANIYDSLTSAYSKNIGRLANDICKIWNQEEVTEEDLNLIRILCFESNATIDFAKTLWFPTRPPEISVKMNKLSKMKMPFFFQYAKSKEIDKVEENNNSLVNKLEYIIPDNRIYFKQFEHEKAFSYKDLMKNKNVEIDDEAARAIIDKHNKINKKKKWMTNGNEEIEGGKKLTVYQNIRKELLEINSDENYVTDVLIKYLYDEKKSRFKRTLWESFGHIIVKNLKFNIQNIKQCETEDCENEFTRTKKRKYCDECGNKREKERMANRKNKSVAENKIV